VVKILQTEDHLPLVKPYLVGTQKLNITVVNEAYNDLLIEEEDHVTLRSSLETYDQYDAIKLARRLEKHELLEFRRIAALLYRVSIFVIDQPFPLSSAPVQIFWTIVLSFWI